MYIINKEILKILEEFKIREEEGLCYLFCVFFNPNCIPEFIPSETRAKVIASNIFYYDKGSVVWKTNLFGEENLQFKWVTSEYIPLFLNIGKEKHETECICRMQKLFYSYPDIRKDEVLEATKLYISTNEVKYIRQPHYFISKGVGKETISDLLTYIEMYRQNNDLKSKSNFIGNKMQ